MTTSLLPISLWATDKSTGEDLYIRAQIPPEGDHESHAAEAMSRYPDYDFSGWNYEPLDS